MMQRVASLALLAMLCACGGGGGGGTGGNQYPAAQSLLNAPRDAANWVLPGQNYSSNRVTPLNQITPRNVAMLHKAWVTPLADDGEQEAAPIVWNGTIYIATPHDNVIALDGKNGAVKWGFGYAPQYVLLYAVNRGVGLVDGKVFMATQDCRVIALDANTGKPVWNIVGCRDTSNSWYSMASYVYDNTVLLGTAGGDTGNIGLVSAFSTADGHRLWDWHTVPTPGEPNFGTWPGKSWEHGGAAVWAGLSLDPATRTLYIAPGNAGPNLTLVGRKGKDLYSESVVALDISGSKPRLKWYYQLLQNDTHDADPAMPPVLFDGMVGDVKRTLLAAADKDGNFVVLDRVTGQRIYRTAVSEQKNILTVPTLQGLYACPNHGGGVEWNGGSYDPRTNYFLVPSTQECAIWKVVTNGPVEYIPGQPYAAGPLPKRQNATGIVTAIDIRTGKVAWRRAFPYPAQGGVTITASGVAFTSDAGGNVYALDPKTGKELWRDNVESSIVAPISTYLIGNQPYVVVVAGEAGNQHTPNLPSTKGSRVVAYTLGASSPIMNTLANQPSPKPMPSERTESGQTVGTSASAPYTPEQVATGKKVFQQSCASCHGALLQGVSAAALTGASFAHSNLTISQMRTIVTTQMPLGAPGSLKPDQYAATMAYLLAYDCVAPSNGGKVPFPTTTLPPQVDAEKVPGATCPR
jgi:alcohol dehydrogenase (cytochrome c)